MDRHATDMILAIALPVVIAVLLAGAMIWRPRALRRAVERHPIGIDRGFRLLMLALFAGFLLAGGGWSAWVFLILALTGTALGRRRWAD